MGQRIIRSGVYQWINEINGKSYVGSSVDLTNRKNRWLYNFKKEMKYKCLLKEAVKKHGVENFSFVIIEECKSTKEILEARENHYIETLKPEYNILKKAYSRAGTPHSEETIEKIRQAHSTDEVKQVHRDYQTQKMADPANRERIANAMKGVPKQTEVWNKGKCLPPEYGNAIREGQQNSEKRKAYAQSLVGKVNDRTSISGEYGVNWLDDKQKWCVRIENKKYGSFKTIEEAIIKRDEIVALPPEERKVADIKLPSSGERNIIWSRGKWIVRIGIKQYGAFDIIADAVKRRNALNQNNI